MTSPFLTNDPLPSAALRPGEVRVIQQPLDMVEREVLIAIERRTPPPENSGAPFVLATPAVDIPVDFDGAHPVYIPPPKVKRDEGKNKFKSAGVAHPEVKRKEEESFRFKDRVQQILTKYCQVPSRELARMNVMEKFRRVTQSLEARKDELMAHTHTLKPSECPPQLGAGTDALTAAVFMLRSLLAWNEPKFKPGSRYRMYYGADPALFSERLADLEMLLIAAKEQQTDSAPLLGFPGLAGATAAAGVGASAAKKSPMKQKAASPAFVSPAVAGAAAALSGAASGASASGIDGTPVMAGAEGARVAQCAAAPPQPSAAAAAALPASSAAAAAALAGATARLAAASNATAPPGAAAPTTFPAGITPGPPMLKPGEWGHVGGRIKALELEHDRLNAGLEIVRAQQSELADLEREYSAYREALETHGKMLEARAEALAQAAGVDDLTSLVMEEMDDDEAEEAAAKAFAAAAREPRRAATGPAPDPAISAAARAAAANLAASEPSATPASTASARQATKAAARAAAAARSALGRGWPRPRPRRRRRRRRGRLLGL